MAITGRFEADFQSFYSAVEKAEAKLTDFQSGAGRVETSLNKMVDNFSGRRLIQEATLSAEAVERIGGKSKLTATELQSLAGKANEAVAKLKAMGVEVPPQIQRLADQLKPIQKDVGGIGDVAKDMGGKLLAAFAVERVIEFALGVGKAQQELQRLGKETRIDVEELQVLTTATKGYGIANEELGRALFGVSQRINSGDASVSRGLHMIGLSLDDVKGKNGKELFLDIERGLATLQGGLRDTAAAEIWGGRMGAAMSGFSTEADAAVDKAQRMNTVLSKDSVAALAEYADAVERTKDRLDNIKNSTLGPLAQGFNTLNETNEKGASWWKIAGAAIVDWANSTVTGQRHGEALATVLDQANRKHEEAAAAKAKEAGASKLVATAVSGEIAARNFLFQLQRDAAKELLPYQLQALKDLEAIGQLNAENAGAIGLSVDQFKKYTDEVKRSEAATKSLTDATIAQQAQLEKIRRDVENTITQQRGTQTQIELANIQKREEEEIASVQRRADALKASLIAQHNDSKENLDKIDADAAAATASIQASFDKLRDGVGVDWKEIQTNTQEALNDIRDRAYKTYVEALHTPGMTREELEKLKQKYREAAEAATASGRAQAEGQKKAKEEVAATNVELQRQWQLQSDLIAKSHEFTSSFSLTAANWDVFKAPTDLNKGGILELLKQGFSLQNAFEILRAKNRGAAIDLSQWPEDMRGPRVPGFFGGVNNFGGGLAMVGERGPELLNLPRGSSVTSNERLAAILASNERLAEILESNYHPMANGLGYELNPGAAALRAEFDPETGQNRAAIPYSLIPPNAPNTNFPTGSFNNIGGYTAREYRDIAERMTTMKSVASQYGFKNPEGPTSHRARGGGSPTVYVHQYVNGVFDPFARLALSSAASDAIMRQALSGRTL